MARIAAVAVVGLTVAQIAVGTEAAGAAVSPNTVGQIANAPAQEGAILAEQGSRYRYVVIHDALREYVDEIRAANPDTDILVYKDLSFVVNDPTCQWAPFQASGVSYCDANPHEDWFLHNSIGQRLSSSGGFLKAANIANPGYRQAWVQSVLARLTNADGSGTRYDGVFMDDTNLFPGHGMDGQIAEMSDSQYRQATVNFVASIGPTLKQAGFDVIPNLSIATWDPAQRSAARGIAGDVTAISREQFVRYSTSNVFSDPVSDTGSWMDELTLMEEIHAAGAGFVAIVYGTANEIEVQRYARATFLLGWDGADGSALAYRTSGGDSHFPDSTTDVGTPLGAREKVGVGWARFFTDGAVVVNPHPSSWQEFFLDGLYHQPDGTCVDSMTLGPRRGLVLPACDVTPPETEITNRPKNNTERRKAGFEFIASEPGSTFECGVGRGKGGKGGKGKRGDSRFEPCASPFSVRVSRGKHEFQVRATDGAGNTDPSPAADDWKTKRRRR